MKKQEIDQETSRLIVINACITIPLTLVFITFALFNDSIAQRVGTSDDAVLILGILSLMLSGISNFIFLPKIRRASTEFRIAQQKQSKSR